MKSAVLWRAGQGKKQGGSLSFTSKEIAHIFGYTEQTVRKWADEFSEYLSGDASPGSGKHRDFQVEDLPVLSFVAEQKNKHATYEEIHASLKAGARGDMPEISEDHLRFLAASESEKQATLEVVTLQRHISDLQTRLNRAEIIATKVEQVTQDNIRLQTRLEMTEEAAQSKEEEITDLKAELKESQRRIEELNRQLGREYTEGFKAGFGEGRGLNGNPQTSEKQSPS
jgi:DNA-binding transcriptional MerR regulator